ncbi:CPXCG motif-containing cysteine-rich protein [Neptunicella sp.]|uniref:CPXCG motif-containing cysteine-rich protein n=1 Tax=Neptunicella sp. TaxID=2125986 RepID=UPI003F6915B9
MNDLIETMISCPYCGEQISVTVEVLDENQEYIEDCQVCCRPIIFTIGSSMDDYPSISVRSEDETF